MQDSGLQRRVDAVLASDSGEPAGLNDLMFDLLEARETAAFIRVWDLAKTRNVEVSSGVQQAMQKLHQRGKGRVPEGTLNLPEAGRRLKAARRLHKICMGPVRGRKLAARSAAATAEAELKAAAWLRTPEAAASTGRV